MSDPEDQAYEAWLDEANLAAAREHALTCDGCDDCTPEDEKVPDPLNFYTVTYGIKPEVVAGFNAYFQASVAKYLRFALEEGMEAAIQRMYDDHAIDRQTGEPNT